MNARLAAHLIAREWRHHPWRQAVALLAVALGVALAFSVHLINRSALTEFSAALRSANGQPDLTLRGQGAGFDDALYERVAADPAVALASPVVEVDTYALAPGDHRISLRVLGIDALRIAPLAPALLPRPATGADRLAMLDPDTVFLNPAARRATGAVDGATLSLQSGPGWQRLRVAGSVAAGGAPLAVMDIAGAQTRFGMTGRLSRIDLRLVPGHDAKALLARLALPSGVVAVAPGAAEARVANLSRAYRVNLTVLALVALFVGAFLVFSVVSLSVAQRTPGFALLGVLGMTARERRGLVLAECATLGAAGSALGLLLGAALAWAALHLLAGDLGGGYFPGIAPALQVGATGAVGFAALGIASALVGGWLPALQAERLSPALALKGLGSPGALAPPAWPGLALLAAGAALAFAPPIAGLPLAAYGAVAALLFGGVALVPSAVHALLALMPTPRSALPLLALQRARYQRRTATAAVAGVVASLALSVALTVMVTSFRDAVSAWLDTVLPADLYARSAASAGAGDQAWLAPGFVAAAARLPGVQRVAASRVTSLQLAPDRPAVTLIARDLAQPAQALPMIEAPLAPAPGEVGVYVSEAMVSLYGAAVGRRIALPLGNASVRPRVLGVWRDYARQFGAIAIDAADYRRLTGDARVNDLAIWLAPGATSAEVQARLRALLPDPAMLEFASTGELRALSLRIFDRSFAVTYYLQAVAIAIGLVGIAASLSAQVLARRKEFGLLAHLGLTRGAGDRGRRRRGRGVDGRRHAGRAAARHRGQPGAGVRRQPAELSLDDAARAAGAAAGTAVRRGVRRRRRHRGLRCTPRGRALGGVVGEGRLVKRRGLLLALLAGAARADGIARGRVLRFPRDHGAHLEARTEWWYATGWSGTEADPRYGFQLTFFRSRTGLAQGVDSRFAARQLLFAHAAITDLAAQRHRHAQRITRWSGDGPTALAAASTADADLRVDRWTLRRDAQGWHAQPARRELRDRSAAAADPTTAAARRRRLLAQGAGRTRSERVHQRAAARGHGHADAGRTPHRRRRPGLARPRVERRAAAPAGRGLGLDRHRPLRRQRAHRVQAAPRRRLGAVGRRQFSRARPGVDLVRARRGALHGRANLDQPRLAGALPDAVAGRDAGRGLRAARADGRAGTRQPREHRRDLLGRPVRAARRAGPARRAGLSRDDRLRRRVATALKRRGGAARSARSARSAQSASIASQLSALAPASARTRSSSFANSAAAPS